jgi:predicted transcriptional regulator YdeE
METLDELELDLSGKAVPACDCIAFEHRGSAARVSESYRAIYAELLPAMDRKPALPFNFESYYPDAGDPYSDSYRFRICIPLA